MVFSFLNTVTNQLLQYYIIFCIYNIKKKFTKEKTNTVSMVDRKPLAAIIGVIGFSIAGIIGALSPVPLQTALIPFLYVPFAICYLVYYYHRIGKL